jgi:ribose 5-phosphate isomerase RpiB
LLTDVEISPIANSVRAGLELAAAVGRLKRPDGQALQSRVGIATGLVAAGTAARGVVIDGAGIGSCMAANKVPGIRAALCYDKASARNGREHNDSNVLTLGARLLTQTQAEEVLRTWMETPFAGGRHQARVQKIMDIERKYLKKASS